MSYTVALNFEDGATHFISCNDGETLLDAAYRQKINLPMACSDGVCGTCKCHCDQGDYDLGDDYLDEALTQEEAADRMVLSCQMRLQSNCVVSVPISAAACKVKPAEYSATISAVTQVSDSTIMLRLALESPEALKFLPGQYVNLGVPGLDEHRAYSFSSKPGEAEASFLIRTVPGGLMSQWLSRDAQAGERMTFVGPSGSFYLRAVERPILMLAGGTGLAPLLSMLEVLADEGCASPVHLIYGVTNDRDLVEIERLETLAGRLDGLTWTACVADPSSNHPFKGYVTQHLTDAHLNAGDCDIYLCGPPAMVEGVRLFLREKGVEPRHFHYEKFAPSAAAA